MLLIPPPAATISPEAEKRPNTFTRAQIPGGYFHSSEFWDVHLPLFKYQSQLLPVLQTPDFGSAPSMFKKPSGCVGQVMLEADLGRRWALGQERGNVQSGCPQPEWGELSSRPHPALRASLHLEKRVYVHRSCEDGIGGNKKTTGASVFSAKPLLPSQKPCG